MSLAKAALLVQPDLTPALVAPAFWWQAPGFSLPGMTNQLFDYFWSLPADWIETPNQRRGGWGGVTKCIMPTGETVYVKRQLDHLFRDPRSLGRRRPTILREWRMLLAMKQHSITVPEPLAFGERIVKGQIQAILVTREMTGFRSLDTALAECQDSESRINILQAAGKLIAQLCASRIVHKSMTGQHLLIREGENDSVEAGVLDLEKTQRSPFKRNSHRDLRKLFLSTPALAAPDKMAILRAYLNRNATDDELAQLADRLAKK